MNIGKKIFTTNMGSRKVNYEHVSSSVNIVVMILNKILKIRIHQGFIKFNMNFVKFNVNVNSLLQLIIEMNLHTDKKKTSMKL